MRARSRLSSEPSSPYQYKNMSHFLLVREKGNPTCLWPMQCTVSVIDGTRFLCCPRIPSRLRMPISLAVTIHSSPSARKCHSPPPTIAPPILPISAASTSTSPLPTPIPASVSLLIPFPLSLPPHLLHLHPVEDVSIPAVSPSTATAFTSVHCAGGLTPPRGFTLLPCDEFQRALSFGRFSRKTCGDFWFSVTWHARGSGRR